jgi:hypothetical protein
MRLPFFSRREHNEAARRERAEQLERSVTSTLRVLAATFTRIADGIEKRRLARAGYHEPERYLERTDPPK